MSVEQDIAARMREDWNRRAVEDAHYYVAFGRRDQTGDEFFDTAREVVSSLDHEIQRLPRSNPRSRRALEIGCGPGRLLKPMSLRFGEIHGVDVSDEMIRRARANLSAIPHAHAHATSGATLNLFADDSFDLVYSYAVFQHIPSKEVVWEYLEETRRVLKPGGVFRAQFNGLPESFPRYDTWSGVRFSAGELVEWTRVRDLQVLSLEGAGTQYMWTTWIKRPEGWRAELGSRAGANVHARLRRITNAHSSEPVAPASGRFASISIWVENLPGEAGLHDLEVLAGGRPSRITYIGPHDRFGVQQVNAILPEGLRTGLVPVELRWLGRAIAEPATLRIIPAGPRVPFIVSISDGVNLLAGTRIETGVVKVTVEDMEYPDEFAASINGQAVEGLETFCTDPQPRRYEVNFQVPAGVRPGPASLEVRLGRRRFAPVPIEVVR